MVSAFATAHTTAHSVFALNFHLSYRFDFMASYECHFATSLLFFPYDTEKTQIFGWSHGTQNLGVRQSVLYGRGS